MQKKKNKMTIDGGAKIFSIKIKQRALLSLLGAEAVEKISLIE